MLLKLATIDSKINPADYIFLVKIVAHKFRTKIERIEDSEAYSIASLELIQAAQSYNPTINEDFSRYAYRAMCNGIIDYIRYNKTKKRTADVVSLTDRDWEEIPEEHLNSIPTDLYTKLMDDSQDSDQDRQDKALLLDIFIQGKKASVIAEEHGVTRTTVYSRLNRIIGKIRQQHADLIGEFNESFERRSACFR